MSLEGMTVNFLGDSITEGTGVENLQNRYDNILKAECGLKAAYNYGVGGTRFAHQRHASEKPRWDMNFCGRAYDMNHDADIIIVFGGTNDYGHGDAPFGKIGDKTPDTFCGAVRFLTRFLQEEYAGARIIFLTPARRLGDIGWSNEVRKYANCPPNEKSLVAKPLKAYADAIVETGKIFGVEVYNLYEELGIDPNKEEDCVRYTADGLHLNDAGHRVLAEYLKKVLA